MFTGEITMEMLPNPIHIRIEDPKLDFTEACRRSKEKAREIGSDPMLLSWYERRTGRYSPEEATCGKGKPAWITYAESRGASITIVVNDGEYVFIYYNFFK